LIGFSLIVLASTTSHELNNLSELPSPIFRFAAQEIPPIAPRAAPPRPLPPPPPPPPPPTGMTISAKPKGNPGSWVTNNDYSAEALSEKRQGLASFSLVIETDGRVKECVIKNSTGHPDLDAMTCELVMRRARFTPAMSNGDVVIGSYYGRIRWQLPEKVPGNNVYEYTIPSSSSVSVRYEVAADGLMANCTVSTGKQQSANNFCESNKIFKPYLDESGKPRRVQVIIYNSVNVNVLDGEGAEPKP
jgi:TonB family protein